MSLLKEALTGSEWNPNLTPEFQLDVGSCSKRTFLSSQTYHLDDN